MFRTITAMTVGASMLWSAAPANSYPTPSNSYPRSSAAAPAASVIQSDDDTATYKLGTGDQLHITTFDEPQLTGDFVVGSDGHISMLMVGDIQARGRTTDEVRKDIEARLADGYIRNPTVSVQVTTLRPFYILGEVNKPGRYPYEDGLTVMSAVATAGGFTYRANTGKVFIKHAGENFEVKEDVTAATEVEAGDTIRIAESYF